MSKPKRYRNDHHRQFVENGRKPLTFISRKNTKTQVMAMTPTQERFLKCDAIRREETNKRWRRLYEIRREETERRFQRLDEVWRGRASNR